MKRKSHKNTGIVSGQLNPCPKLPNCICSEFPDDRWHFRKPWEYQGSREEAMEKLIEALKGMIGAKVVEADQGYVHAEFKVPVVGFIDDVEFRLPDKERKVYFRSASRIGTWDLELNKLRLAWIRRRFFRA